MNTLFIKTTNIGSGTVEEKSEASPFIPKELMYRNMRNHFNNLKIYASLYSQFNNEIQSFPLEKSTFLIKESTITTLNENEINKQRLLELEKNFTNTLMNYLIEEDFEDGIHTKADLLLQEQININSLATKEWLNKIYINHYNNTKILLGILKLIANLKYSEIGEIGATIALAALAHKNIEVVEAGIRAFEKWRNIESLKILQDIEIRTKPKWLLEYLNAVIADLEEELCQY